MYDDAMKVISTEVPTNACVNIQKFGIVAVCIEQFTIVWQIFSSDLIQVSAFHCPSLKIVVVPGNKTDFEKVPSHRERDWRRK